MGRETKFLLALLGLLGGVFLGVLSLKLFVPRPPAGAGPDVHGALATTEAQALVDPPDFHPPAAADPLTAAAPPPPPEAPETAAPLAPPAARRFGAADAARDPFLTAASYETTEPPAGEAVALEPPPAADHAAAADLLPPPAFEPVMSPPAGETATAASDSREPPPSFSPPAAAVPVGDTYVAQPGDSWWSLAERAYGDGRLYRALFAWNRMLDPRVSLVPGTRLEIPPAAQLGASWPGLLPRD